MVHAVLQNKHDLIKLLSDRGAHLRHVDHRAICHATTRLDLPMLQVVLQSGADPNAILPNNAPILFYLIGTLMQQQALDAPEPFPQDNQL